MTIPASSAHPSRTRIRSSGLLGILIGLAAAFAFGAGGVIAKPLFEHGWSPLAAVLARTSIAAIVLAVPGLISVRFDLRPLWRARWPLLIYGCLGVAGVQFAFYAAIQRIPVAMTLLIEYLAPVVLVIVAWVAARRPPASIVLVGSAVAVAGLVLIVGPGGEGLDPLGLLLAMLAMAGFALYYLMSEKIELPPMAMIAGGFAVGAPALWLVALTGIMPVQASFGPIAVSSWEVPWWALILTVGVFGTAFAYGASVLAIRILGSRMASFLGLTEVLFAGLVGWALLGEAFGPVQMVGGVLILGGVVLVRLERTPQSLD